MSQPRQTRPRSSIVLGGPGCGKTTYLLKRVEEYIAAGGHPSRIAFVSFTRRAIQEARERALDQLGIDADSFTGRGDDDPLPYFRTLHSMATRLRRDKTKKFLTHTRYRQWCEAVDIHPESRAVKGRVSLEYEVTYATEDDAALFASGYARVLQQDLKQVTDFLGMSYEHAKQRDAEYRLLLDEGYIDHTAVLEGYVEDGESPEFDLLIVDEAQDLSLLQWRCVEKLEINAKEIIYAGDDDQAIYEWSGADVGHFLSLRDTCEKIVLPKSHRLPSVIWKECTTYAVEGIKNRITKEFEPNKEGGVIDSINDDEIIALSLGRHATLGGFNNGETWFLLARTADFLKKWRKVLRTFGVLYMDKGQSSLDSPLCDVIKSYIAVQNDEDISGPKAYQLLNYLHPDVRKGSPEELGISKMTRRPIYPAMIMKRFDLPWWKVLDLRQTDIDYIKGLLDSGYTFDSKPPVTLGTIHSVKGAEADNVILSRRITNKIRSRMALNPDTEARVAYVGMSRARKRLFYYNHKDDLNV